MTDGKNFHDADRNHAQAISSADLATVRLTVNVTFNLNGELPGAARDALIRMVDRAIVQGPLPGEADVRVVEHEFEFTQVHAADTGGPRDTDFSQLLDL